MIIGFGPGNVEQTRLNMSISYTHGHTHALFFLPQKHELLLINQLIPSHTLRTSTKYFRIVPAATPDGCVVREMRDV